VKYNGTALADGPTDAGKYAITISVAAGTGYDATTEDLKLDTFRIVGKIPTIEDLKINNIPKDATYNGKEYKADITHESEGLGAITVRYNGNTRAPSDPGNYAVTVDLAQGTAFEAVNGLEVGTLSIASPPPPPVITRKVELPVVSGVTLLPAAGSHNVTSGSNFSFTITGAKVIPEVTSSAGNTVTKTKNSDGSYTITVYGITSNISLTIDVTTGNAAIEGTQLWSSTGRLYIASSQSGEARIYNLTGTQVKALTLSSGETVSEPLATGLYIVTLNGKTQKIHVH
jgi:hypothetical protein